MILEFKDLYKSYDKKEVLKVAKASFLPLNNNNKHKLIKHFVSRIEKKHIFAPY